MITASEAKRLTALIENKVDTLVAMHNWLTPEGTLPPRPEIRRAVRRAMVESMVTECAPSLNQEDHATCVERTITRLIAFKAKP